MNAVWIQLPGLGPVRTTTVVAALVILFGVGIYTRRPWLALVTVLGWVSAYELIFNATGIFVFGWPRGGFLWAAAAISAWVVLAYREGVRPDRVWLLIFAVAWAAWLIQGFHSNIPTGRPWSEWGEIWNEVTKTALAVSYLLGALAIESSPSTSSRAAIEVPQTVPTRAPVH